MGEGDWLVERFQTHRAHLHAVAYRMLGSLRACASRWSWAAAWAILPAVVGPGAADEPATDNGGAGQRSPELDHQPAALGAPAQLAVLVAPGVGALDHPAAAPLDRCRHPTGSDRTGHPPLGQDLPAGLPVVAGVQVHGERSWQGTDRRGGDGRPRGPGRPPP